MSDDRLVVARGVPSESLRARLRYDATTWFTTWKGALHDAWWVIGPDDEDRYVEIATVRFWDASRVTPQFATIEDAGLVDTHALVVVAPPSEIEWERSVAETRAIVMSNPELHARYEELLNSRHEDDES